MKREYVITAAVSAVIGAGLMLLAIGGSRSAGIEGWVPVNRQVAVAMNNGSQGDTTAPLSASGTVADKPNRLDEAAVGEHTAVASSDNTAVAATAENEAAAPSQPSSVESEQDGLISVNTANMNQLQTIPGIGEKKAQAIINYRNEHGSFKSLSDLKKVKGIGDKVLQKMKPYIKL
ncbi:ComE operon protein 1 [compost metagenome]